MPPATPTPANAERQRPCGNLECRVSTGVHEGLTFGSGELSIHGYWSKPCRVCATAWNERREAEKTARRRELARVGASQKEIERIIAESDWLNIPGWPFADEAEVAAVLGIAAPAEGATEGATT